MSEIQSVVFNPKQFSPTQARAWLKANNIKPIKMVDRTPTQLRYRIQRPGLFKRFRTKIIKSGIMLIIGFKSN